MSKRPTPQMSPAAQAFFWDELIDRHTEHGCWYWLGRTIHGYGVGANYQAHRLAYELARGPIPPGLFVRHTCGNRQCCQPEHLYLGSVADNASRAWIRKRQAGASYTARRTHKHLNAAQVVEIRARHAAGETLNALSERFGVTRQCLANVVKGKTFAGVH